MREVDRNSYGHMDFQDFCIMIRQFLDLQAEEKANREQRAIDASGFSTSEVQEFRELFNQTDTEDHGELMWADIKGLVVSVSKPTAKSTAVLYKAFHDARSERALLLSLNKDAVNHPEGLDFPEFLNLMKALLASDFCNFGGIKDKKRSWCCFQLLSAR